MNDNIKAGADHHAGDGGYSEGTQEKYNEFVKGRNQSLAKARLEGLWWKARIGYNNQNCDPEVLEKFAQLILIEVTDILSTYRGKMVFEDGAEYNYEHPIIAIRKHFGVEE